MLLWFCVHVQINGTMLSFILVKGTKQTFGLRNVNASHIITCFPYMQSTYQIKAYS